MITKHQQPNKENRAPKWTKKRNRSRNFAVQREQIERERDARRCFKPYLHLAPPNPRLTLLFSSSPQGSTSPRFFLYISYFYSFPFDSITCFLFFLCFLNFILFFNNIKFTQTSSFYGARVSVARWRNPVRRSSCCRFRLIRTPDITRRRG